MEPIQFIGMDVLDEFEKATVNKLCAEYYEKIRRSLNNMTQLVVHLKEYKKQGKKTKYGIHVRAISPTKEFESTKAADWDLARTLHKAFDGLEKEIQHRLKDLSAHEKKGRHQEEEI